MKQKISITIALIIGTVFFSFSQNSKEIKEKRVAFITKFLELTPDESKVFFPIYKQRKDDKIAKIKPYRKAKGTARKKIEEMSDDEVLKLMDNGLIIRQIELDIEKEYLPKFLAVLPPKKVAKLYHIEKRFKQRQKAKKNKAKREEIEERKEKLRERIREKRDEKRNKLRERKNELREKKEEKRH